MTDKNCLNCAFCSEHYPSFKDTCDKDNHVITNVEKECCENYKLLQEVDNAEH